MQRVTNWDGESLLLVAGLRVPSSGATVVTREDIGKGDMAGGACYAETDSDGLMTLAQ